MFVYTQNSCYIRATNIMCIYHTKIYIGSTDCIKLLQGGAAECHHSAIIYHD